MWLDKKAYDDDDDDDDYGDDSDDGLSTIISLFQAKGRLGLVIHLTTC